MPIYYVIVDTRRHDLPNELMWDHIRAEFICARVSSHKMHSLIWHSSDRLYYQLSKVPLTTRKIEESFGLESLWY